MHASGAQPQPISREASPTVAGGFVQYWPAMVVTIAVLVLFWDVIAELVGDWIKDPDYSHGFFVPIFSAYLIWRQRHSLPAAKPTWWGLLFVLSSLGLLFLGSLGAELFLTRVGLV